MTDTDIQDARIRRLVNAAVDRELADHRVAPPWQPAEAPHRPGHPAGRWSLPVLAASVAALLVAVTVLAIGSGRDRRATPAGPSTSPAPSVSQTSRSGPQGSDREYAKASAAAAPDPHKLAGITISPLTAAEARKLKGTGALRADNFGFTNPQPGKSYSFTMSYLAGPGAETAVVSIDLQSVASGSCPPPFLARANASYRIRCQVTFRADTLGTAQLTVRAPSGSSSILSNLIDPAANYDRAVADAPAASAVAGVSERPATAAERRIPVDSVGSTHEITDPKPGRSYPITLLYVPASAAPPVSVLSFRFEGVAAGSCPRAFRVRQAHAYQISCQVTFKPGAKGWVYYDVTGPQGVEPTGLGLF